jgi:hypothetical protein
LSSASASRLSSFALLALAVASPLAVAADGVATQTAQYQVTFDAVWSLATHPTAFPPSPHFSGLVGATHDAGVSFWEPGGTASPGMESMAETGSKSPLTSEINGAIMAGTAGALISGGGIGLSPNSVSKTFDITQEHSLVSLVTMIAPSPDWFVGVHGLELFVAGDWVDELVIDLDAYDSGTDSGPSFTSPNANTNPQDPISLITGFPFASGVPLGTFTFTRLDAPDPWSDLGGALAGASGEPALVGSGELSSGETIGLDVTGALPLAPAALVLGASELGLPLKGGTLVPNPDFIVFGLATAGDGSFSLSATWPAGVPAGVPLVAQLWITDAAGPKGFAATNGVCSVTK